MEREEQNHNAGSPAAQEKKSSRKDLFGFTIFDEKALLKRYKRELKGLKSSLEDTERMPVFTKELLDYIREHPEPLFSAEDAPERGVTLELEGAKKPKVMAHAWTKSPEPSISLTSLFDRSRVKMIQQLLKEEKLVNKEIQTDLRRMAIQMRERITVGVFGLPRSGRSTLINMMSDASGIPIDLSDQGIVENCIYCMKELLKTFYQLKGADTSLSSPRNEEYAKFMSDIPIDSQAWNAEVSRAIEELYKDPILLNSLDYCVCKNPALKSAAYLFDNIARFSTVPFEVKVEDMLRVYKHGAPRKADVEIPRDNGVKLFVSELDIEKPFHFFRAHHELTSIIFLVDLTSYDRDFVFPTGERINELEIALDWFSSLMPVAGRSENFNLLLSNRDIFQMKITKGGGSEFIKSMWPDFEGPDGDPDAAIAFIIQKFRDIVEKTNTGRNENDFLGCGRSKLRAYCVDLRDRDDFRTSMKNLTDAIIHTLLAH